MNVMKNRENGASMVVARTHSVRTSVNVTRAIWAKLVEI